MNNATWHDLLYPGDATDFFERIELRPFDPLASGYDPNNARWLMELSRLVYRHDSEEIDPPPQPRRTELLANAGYRQVRFFQYRGDGIDTQAMLVASTAQPFHAVLAFRGTEQGGEDLKTDIKVWKNFIDALKSVALPHNGDEIRVHQGFKDALDPVWDQIAAELAALQCPVFYTGHSLGAALATLAAVRRAPQALYTFGSPRVGNLEFVHALANIPTYRVVDDEDIVATVPPAELGFVHAGAEQRLTATKPSSLMARLKNLCAPPKPLADHTPINYTDRI